MNRLEAESVMKAIGKSWFNRREIFDIKIGLDSTDPVKYTLKEKKEKKMDGCAPGFATPTDVGAIYKACAVTTSLGYQAQEQQKECNMCIAHTNTFTEDESLEQESRKHLKARARDVREAATTAAIEKFNINPLYPKTWGEFRNYIRNGFISVKDSYKLKGDEDGGHEAVKYDWPYAIEFRDPSKPKDQAGFDAAKKDIERDYENVVDAIMTLEPREAREELKTFAAKY